MQTIIPNSMIDQTNYIFFKNLPTRLGQLVMLIAASELVGWVLDISVLKRILPDFKLKNNFVFNSGINIYTVKIKSYSW